MALGLIIFGRHSGFSAARHKVVLVVISFEYCTARRRFLQAPPRKTYLNSCCPMFCTSAIFYPSPTVLAWESKAILTKACKSFQPHATHFKICSTFSGRSKTVGGLPSIISCTIAFCHPLPFFQGGQFFRWQLPQSVATSFPAPYHMLHANNHYRGTTSLPEEGEKK